MQGHLLRFVGAKVCFLWPKRDVQGSSLLTRVFSRWLDGGSAVDLPKPQEGAVSFQRPGFAAELKLRGAAGAQAHGHQLSMSCNLSAADAHVAVVAKPEGLTVRGAERALFVGLECHEHAIRKSAAVHAQSDGLVGF